MPPKPTIEEIRRSQILDAALNTIAQLGAEKVTLDDIARAAGLSKGGLVHYFANKELLFKEAFREFFDRVFDRSKQTMAQFEDPRDKLLSFSWLFDRSDPDLVIGYPLMFDCMVRAVRDVDYRKLFHEWVENWVALLTRALEQGVAAGSLSVSDPDAVARAISAVYHGVAVRWYLDPDGHSKEWAVDSFHQAIYGLLDNA